MSDGDSGSAAASTGPSRGRRLAEIAGTLLLGTAGGYIFYLLHLPLPWMMGAMCFTVVAALAGAPVRGPGRIRDAMMAIIGLMIGGAFTPDILGEAGRWTFSLAGVTVYALGITASFGWALRRFAHFSPPRRSARRPPAA